MKEAFLAAFNTGAVHTVLHAAKVSSPFWIPMLFVMIAFDVWLTWKRREWIKTQGSVLLEIRLPREMTKSPAAMELFLSNLYNSAAGSLINVYIKGQVRVWYSLELVSIDGNVHFFLWCHKGLRNRTEAQLYAQFPNVEVHEVADYSLGVERNPEKLTFGWFSNFIPTKAEAYPIKTYIDYGLDKNPDEEFKIDPIVSVLEFLGSLKRGEQVWIQILIRAHAKEGLKLGRIFVKPDWKGGVEKEIKEILKKGLLKPAEDKTLDSTKHLSQGQRDVIVAIERNAGKTAFDTMIRATYFAEKEAFNPTNIGGLIGSISQFGSPSLNGFRPQGNIASEYPWQDPFGRDRKESELKYLEAYKRRAFFERPFKNYKSKPFVMSVEELATIYHFPGEVAATPTLSRIPSKKAEAPSNLPI
ncbi:hypothetical protein KW790_00920 [Candidatus Parcubacteria bacterium]|nr:hypothetical protein [Candidatus Parcubacteria bacterium]